MQIMRTTKSLLTSLFVLSLGMNVLAQAPVAPAAAPKADTARKPVGPNGPKAYKEVITAKAQSYKGMFWTHKVDEKYFFEIPDSLLGREILVVNRIAKAPADLRSGGFFGYAGDQIGQNVIRFEKGPNNKIFLRSISYGEYAKDSTSPMFQNVTNSNVQPIAASFDIKALGKDSAGVVIDMTDYISGDNDVLFFNSSLKSSLRFAAPQPDKSYIINVRSYPINVEIRTVKTYTRMAAPPVPGGFGGGPSGAGNMTMELNSSLVLLPKKPMQARYFDPRVGYFAVGYTDYDANPQGVKDVVLVKRWRLEPKDEDLEKYKRGELVEPKKPIIFYIDPATPAKWVPYLMQGVDDWKVAFEQAGFKNAILAKRAPTKEEDSTWSLDDARNSAIVYKPSDIPNASGPSISDPRSGEIMESHINWYHNVMELLRNWYMIQCGPLDPRANQMAFDDALMGQLIRFVSSHEVGHTIGLRHNYGSSSAVPVDSLRNKAWVEKNGHTPSIMDYARFNYVAQPQDKVSEIGLFPRIGDYDKWAIEWGYRRFDQFRDQEEEKGYLNQWVMDRLKNKRLWFGTETNPDDPRSQSEQVGDDAMKGSYWGTENLKRIVPNLMKWTRESNEGYDGLRTMYGEVVNQFNRYNGHVVKYVGGIMETPKTVEQEGAVYEIVSKAKQKEAVAYLNKTLFETPKWLLNNDVFAKTGQSGLTTIGGVQDNILNRMLSTRSLSKLIDAEASLGNNAYRITDLLGDMKSGIYAELTARKSTDIFRRNLQKSYVMALTRLIDAGNAGSSLSMGGISIQVSGSSVDKTDLKSVVKAHLSTLRSELLAASTTVADPMTRYHWKDLADRIEQTLKPGK
jgi:hypothetical protein